MRIDEMEEILIVKDLTIGFPGRAPLMRDINLSGRRGELIALIGRNGIGKSTLLKTLVNLIKPVAGEIFFEGKESREYSTRQLAEKTGYVSTEIIRTGNLRVFDLVALGRSPHTNWMGKITGNDRVRVEDAIQKVGLEAHVHNFISELSDGERQRAMVARTLAQDTPVIILDEPTAYLDLPGRYEMIHLLRELSREENKTILFSSHDLNLVMGEADKIWMMQKEGMVEGAPEDLALNETLSRIFSNAYVQFDLKSGGFIIQRPYRKQIRVVGKGDVFYWTNIALNRAGFETIENPPEQFPVVEAKKGKWTLEWDVSGKKNFTSLYSLLKHLNSKVTKI